MNWERTSREEVSNLSWSLVQTGPEAAGIPRGADGRLTLRFHDLRREFASRLLESGATLAEVQAALGHCNITMTSRYLGVTDTGLQRAFARLEQYARAMDRAG